MQAPRMVQSRDFGAVTDKYGGESRDNAWSDDLDNLPLVSRRKLLLAIKSRSDANGIKSGVCEVEEESRNITAPNFDVAVKTEEDQSDSEKLLPPTLTHIPGSAVQPTDSDGKTNETVWSSDLDLIPLSARKKMLLAAREFSQEAQCEVKSMHGTAVVVKKENEHYDTQGCLGGAPEDLTRLCFEEEAKKQKEAVHSIAEESLVYVIPEKKSTDICRSSATDSSKGVITGILNQCLSSPSLWTDLPKPRSDIAMQDNDQLSSFGQISSKPISSHGQDVMLNRNVVHSRVKIEPLDNIDMPNLDRNAVGNAFNIVQVKSELKTTADSNGDELDHMLLCDRLNLLRSGVDFASNSIKNSECSEKAVPTAAGCSPLVFESVKPISIKRPRKRKKTATDSVETALEEDAPGLLQVLIDKGITVDEIKLYGETENDDPLDESFSEDSFSDLEDVISKLFSQRNSLLKFAPIRCAKGAKATYCLACLFSLVEQSRYLRFRKWPVEWGWCRDLQSFIFVFERHRRIVLERPEYGYATYFFELVESLPVHWQIKRLVIAMKLPACSRVTLIENKALLVGEDLSEGEARVLMEYGWIRNTGLGTMLNYRDRVVHDRKSSENISEWRSKIGKLLMDGYNGGATTILHTFTECQGTEIPEIKQELC